MLHHQKNLPSPSLKSLIFIRKKLKINFKEPTILMQADFYEKWSIYNLSNVSRDIMKYGLRAYSHT